MNDIQETSIVHILQNVTGSCDFGSVDDYPGETMDERRTAFWQEVIRVKSADTGFGHLVDSILEEGFHGSAVGWADGGGIYNQYYINEGHHRLVAAILLGMDSIPTATYGKSGDHPAREGMQGYFSAHDNCGVDTSIDVDI